MLDEQVAHVVGRAARWQLVKHLMGEGGVAGQLTQNRLTWDWRIHVRPLLGRCIVILLRAGQRVAAAQND